MTTTGLEDFVQTNLMKQAMGEGDASRPKGPDSEAARRAQSPANSKRLAAAKLARVNPPKTVLGDHAATPSIKKGKTNIGHGNQSDGVMRVGFTSKQMGQRDVFDTDVDSIGDTTTMSMSQPASLAEAGQPTSNTIPGRTISLEIPGLIDARSGNNDVRMSRNEESSIGYVEEGSEGYNEDEESGGEGSGPHPQDGPDNSTRNLREFLQPGETREFQSFIRGREALSLHQDPDNWREDLPSRRAVEIEVSQKHAYLHNDSDDGVKRRHQSPSATSEESREFSNQNESNLWKKTNTRSRRNLLKQGPRIPLHSTYPAHQRSSSQTLSNPKTAAQGHIARMPQVAEVPDTVTFAGSEISSEVLNEMSKGRNEHSTDSSRSGLKRGADLDYSQEQLLEMSYCELENQPFDEDPRVPSQVLSPELNGRSLAEKLEYLLNPHETLPSDTTQQFENQCRFFSSLNIEQYEECGDLIVDQFAGIIKRFSGIRRDKRKTAVEFETEISKREAVVMGRKESLEKDLGRLRKAGQDVVRGGNG